MLGRWLFRIFAFFFVLALFAAAYLRVTYGDGLDYVDLTTKPLLPIPALQSAVTFEDPVGNVAVAPDGRIFFTVHPESHPATNKLMVAAGKDVRPFPDATSQSMFETVLGLRIDGQGRLWTIDGGHHGFGKVRLIAFDIKTGAIVHDHIFDGATAPLGSLLQDMAISADGRTIYIADASFWRRSPAIVVYDVASKSARRVLQSHPSLRAQNWLIRNPVRVMRFFGGLLELKTGLEGITLDPTGEWLIYGAMTHDTLYRVRTADLLNPALDSADLTARLQSMGPKPLSAGFSHDLAGNIYITDIEHSAILRKTLDGRLETVIKDSRIRWADSLSFGPNGYLYVSDSALPDQLLQSQAHMAAAKPYHIFRFKPGVPGTPGQ